MFKKLHKVTYGSTNDRPLLLEETEIEPPTKRKKQNKLISRKKSVPKLALYYTVASGRAVLDVLDTMGEFLAELFGITPPLYWYVVEEYERQKAAEKEGGIYEAKVRAAEEGGVCDSKATTCLTDNEEDIILDTGKIG